MALDLRLEIKMSQQLVMTPQLQQAIKMLQLSRMDLIEAVREELMENPMLEENSEIESTEARIETAAEVEKKEAKEETKDVKGDESLQETDNQIDWEAYFENYSSPTPGTGTQRLRDDDMPSYEASLTRETSLFDHLMWQLQVSDFNEQEQLVAIRLIGNINDHGYLRVLDDVGEPLDGDEIIARMV